MKSVVVIIPTNCCASVSHSGEAFMSRERAPHATVYQRVSYYWLVWLQRTVLH
jgi:hypothetical protein